MHTGLHRLGVLECGTQDRPGSRLSHRQRSSAWLQVSAEIECGSSYISIYQSAAAMRSMACVPSGVMPISKLWPEHIVDKDKSAMPVDGACL